MNKSVVNTVVSPAHVESWTFRIVPALVLFAAASLKTWQFVFVPEIDGGTWETVFVCALIQFEFCLGFLLASGWKASFFKQVGLATFAFFGVVSVHKLLSGETSCGCFGQLVVTPFQSLLLDSLCVLSLLMWQTLRTIKIDLRLMALCGVTVIVSSCFIVFNPPSRLSLAGEIVGNGSTVIIETELWNGRSFPLFSYIDGEKSFLNNGDWQVLLYSDSCKDCLELISEIQLQHETFPPTLCLNLTGASESRPSDTPTVRWRNLDSNINWIGDVPVWLRLENGVVRN